MNWIIVTLSVILLVLGYLLAVLIIKNNKLTNLIGSYLTLLGVLYVRIKNTNDHMRTIDRLGAFEADDEVGHTFKELQSLTDDLYQFLKKYIDQEHTTPSNESKDKTTKEEN